MADGSQRGNLREFFEDNFIDRSEPRLLDQVDFSAIIGTTLKSLLLVVFLGFVGLADAAGQAFTTTLQAFQDMIRLIVTAPTLTLVEIQQRATEIAAREVLDFGIVALPVSVVAALAAIGVIVVVVNVFWRP